MTARPADPSVAPREEAPTGAVLADLRRLAQRATPGPWRWFTDMAWRRLHSEAPVNWAVMKPFINEEGRADCCIRERDAAYIAAANPQAVLALLDAYAAAREALRGIIESGALSEVESVVAGWRGPDGTNDPHPSRLGATIKTNCGRMYKLADALAIARAHLPQARAAEEGERAEREKIRKEIEDDVMAGRGFPKIKCEHKWVGSRYDGRRLHCEYCGIMEAAPRAE